MTTKPYRPALQRLEDRLVPAFTAALQDGTLTVQGDAGNDQIQICQFLNNTIRVLNLATNRYVNVQGANGDTVDAAAVTAINVNAGAGANVVKAWGFGNDNRGLNPFPTPFTGPVRISAGPGNDTLENWLFPDCEIQGGGGVDRFDSNVYSTLFREPFNPDRPALPGPGPAPFAAAYTDIAQGKNDDCYFLAALSSLALTNHNLQGRIHHEAGTGYTVDLFGLDPSTKAPKLRGVSVEFDGSWTPREPSQPQAGEYWTILYARAFKKLMQEEGITDPRTDEAFRALAGRRPSVRQVGQGGGAFSNADALRLRQVLAAGGNATVRTPQGRGPAWMTGDPHWYTVVAVTPNGAGYNVTLRNPWGRGPNGGPAEVTVFWTQVASVITDIETNTPMFVSDGRGGLFQADVNGLSLLYVGQTRCNGRDVVMFDIAMNGAGQLLGLGSDRKLYRINRDTAATTEIGAINDQSTNRPITHNLNALVYRSDGGLFLAGAGALYEITRISAAGATARKVATLPDRQQSSGDLAFDPQGNLYLTTTAGAVLKLARGASTLTYLVRPNTVSGIDQLYGMVWDNGDLYAFNNRDSKVYRINTSNGAVNYMTYEDGINPEVDHLRDPLHRAQGVYGAASVPV